MKILLVKLGLEIVFTLILLISMHKKFGHNNMILVNIRIVKESLFGMISMNLQSLIIMKILNVCRKIVNIKLNFQIIRN